MRGTFRVWMLGLGLGLGLEAGAWAGGEGDLGAAGVAFRRGEGLFASGEYAAALAAFEAGYAQSQQPAFLFDIGHTYRAMGNPQRAVEFYRAYLKAQPDSADRPAIEAAIVEQERKLAVPAVPLAAPLVGEVAAKPVVVAPLLPTGKSEGRAVYKSWWFWTATGAAVSAVAIGLGVGLAPAQTDLAKEVTWR